jgi:hypothetical protein
MNLDDGTRSRVVKFAVSSMAMAGRGLMLRQAKAR